MHIGYLLARSWTRVHTVLKPDVPVVLYPRSVTPAPIGKKQEDENFRASFGYIGSSEATVVYPGWDPVSTNNIKPTTQEVFQELPFVPDSAQYC